MHFEKLERRCLMDASSLGGVCTSPLPVEPPALQSVQVATEIYGPIQQIDPVPQGEGDNSEMPAKLDFTGEVEEVDQLMLYGYEVRTSPVPGSTGLRAALDILEASPDFAYEWAKEGIEAVLHSGDTYYFKLTTPVNEWIVLGERAVWVNVSEGSVFTYGRF